eukprot:Pgem_evm1s5539
MNDEKTYYKKTYYSSREARELLGITNQTLRRWSTTGKINTTKFPSGQFGYFRKDIDSILNEHGSYSEDERSSICYARVSSRQQKDDLQRQINMFKQEFPEH